jgi:hypothetical protein
VSTIIVAEIDGRVSSVGLADDVVRLRRYLDAHPPSDPHLLILLQGLLASLSAYAVAEAREIVAQEADEDDGPPPVHAQRVIQ